MSDDHLPIDRVAWKEQEADRLNKILAANAEPKHPEEKSVTASAPPRRELHLIEAPAPPPAKPRPDVDFGLPADTEARRSFIDNHKHAPDFTDQLREYDKRISTREELRASIDAALIAAGQWLSEFINTEHYPAGSSVGGQFMPHAGGRAVGRTGQAGPGGGAQKKSKPLPGQPGWGQDHGISDAQYKAYPFSRFSKLDGKDPNADARTRAQIQALATKDDGTVDQGVSQQLTNAARQSSIVELPRHAVPGSPFGSITSETRPDLEVLSLSRLADMRRDRRAWEALTPAAQRKAPEPPDIFNADGSVKLNSPELAKAQRAYGAKYLFPSGAGKAARIDLNPGINGDNEKHFLNTDPTKGGNGPVYVVMEGSLKNASALTAIRDPKKRVPGETNASTIAIPSVTLAYGQSVEDINDAIKEATGKRDRAKAKISDPNSSPAVVRSNRASVAQHEAKLQELQQLSKATKEHESELAWVTKNYLQGREVRLVIDADGADHSNVPASDKHPNPEQTKRDVSRQGRLLQSYLQNHGAGQVDIYSPPLTATGDIPKTKLSNGGTDEAKGLDDYLGGGKGTLGGLVRVPRTAEPISLTGVKGFGRKDFRTSSERLYALLQNTAGPNGEVKVSSRALGRTLGLSHRAIQSYVARLKDAGLLKVTKAPPTSVVIKQGAKEPKTEYNPGSGTSKKRYAEEDASNSYVLPQHHRATDRKAQTLALTSKIRSLRSGGKTYEQIAKALGISTSTVGNALQASALPLSHREDGKSPATHTKEVNE